MQPAEPKPGESPQPPKPQPRARRSRNSLSRSRNCPGPRYPNGPSPSSLRNEVRDRYL